jgi:uncharacterized membrane protein YdbT with pleckstrin-like domain
MKEFRPNPILNNIRPLVFTIISVILAMGVGIWISIPFFIWLGITWLIDICTIWEVYDDEIIQKRGVFNQRITEMKLHRIKTMNVYYPFWMRLFDHGIITISNTDSSTGSIIMYSLDDPEVIRKELWTMAETQRRDRQINEYDLNRL